MRTQIKSNKYRIINSLILIYALIITFIIPTQIFANTFPPNSVFNQRTAEQEQKATQNTDKSFGKTSVYFEENKGQFDKRVKYFARGTNGYSLFLTATEAVYVLQESSKFDVQNPKSADSLKNLALDSEIRSQDSRKATAVFMKLVEANENSNSVGLEQMSNKTNYFKGKKSDWRTEIPNFRQVQMNNVYQGIDTVWHGKEDGGVQYDFVVQPNANPNQIEWEIEGAESVEIDEKGDLLIKTEFGEIRQQKPFTYQENSNGLREEIQSQFVIKDQSTTQNLKSRIAFEVGNHDRTKQLTIDPSVNLRQLATSTYFGGNGDNDKARKIQVDRMGFIYIIGETNSVLFPTSPGTFDSTFNGLEDAFVSKLNPSAKELIFSSYLGGNLEEIPTDLKVDQSGNIYVSGITESSNFPTTSGAFDTTLSADFDGFLTKLDPNGTSLVYSTLIGDSDLDVILGLAINNSGEVFITGYTKSSSFPTTAGAFDTTINGTIDMFAARFNSAGSNLIYSTFMGGSGIETLEFGVNIDIDSANNAYVMGVTAETNFPTTSTAFDQSHNGDLDVFVVKFNDSGSGVFYSTYIGGSGTDEGNGLAVDINGNAYITGRTEDSTTDYPAQIGSYDVLHNGMDDAFITKLDTNGENLEYSSFIGGSEDDEATDIAVDYLGFAYIVGATSFPSGGGAGFPTVNAYQSSYPGGSSDIFVTKMNSSGTDLNYSTLFGSGETDYGISIAIDKAGNILTLNDTFATVSNTYPLTLEAFQTDPDSIGITKFGDYPISGRTVDHSGNPLPNTAVQMSGIRSDFALTDSQGYFSFLDTVPVGNTPLQVTVSATNLLYNFNPSTINLEFLYSTEINFVGRPTSSGPTAAFADIGGTVESTVGNVGLPNTRLTLIDTVNGNVSVVNTDANGDYEFEGVTTGMFYLVVAEREGYNFAPQIFEVNHLDENSNLDFRASPNSPRPVDDFDGDGKTDLAVFRPESGTWYILNSQDNSVKTVQFGVDGDIPVASDYDGDNRADIAVYRPSDGNWYRLHSSDGQFNAVHFGAVGDKPVQADFDGDGKTDLAVYRPQTGVWHQLLSENGNYTSARFGIETDQPIAADYDSDGKADLSVFRDGIWYRLRSSDGQAEAFQFGVAEDKPLAVDFDGDGRMDTAVFRPSNGAWYWLESSDGDFQAKQFGTSTDIPTPADYNGDGRYEQSIFRNGTWFVLRNDNSFYAAQFGQSGDVPIP